MADRDTPVCEDTHVEYRVSLHPSKSAGYQSKARNRGTVTLFLPVLWERSGGDVDAFVDELVCVSVLERICLERAWQKIRMKNRCHPTCKMEKIMLMMMFPDKWDAIRSLYI